jgi:lipoprotein NlpD
MRTIVKIFLPTLAFFLIIFLTGCAQRGYHKPVANIAAAEVLPAFRWPLTGRVLCHYGSLEDGVTLKGIVLQGEEGQRVFAAEQGQVVYVDDSLRGYGKTLVLEHGRSFSTVYARNSQILVRVGDSVRRGQKIANIGRAGKGSTAQLYFEIRRDAKTLDPELVLK